MNWPPSDYDWPLATHSRQYLAAGHRWHLQILGDGPSLLLLHGAGGAGQSWRHLAPLLAQRWQVVIVDLVGQGFSQAGKPHRFGLPQMAEDLSSLLTRLGCQPAAIIGHSAGAAVALQMVRRDGLQKLTETTKTTPRVVAINPALSAFGGLAGWLFPVLARVLARAPFTAELFSGLAGRPDKVKRLLDATGSRVNQEMCARYLQLIRDRDHVSATLKMMAQWDVAPLLRQLPQIEARTLMLLADNDKTVPPKVGAQAAKLMKHAQVASLAGLGHLAHEEAAPTLLPLIEGFLMTPEQTR
ncbi:alpha/beta fold hydrolase BchO [Phaeobacter sp.]|uniref:alpha/beta fold hydrolase BchO n=1 Tax=Phaeobacter sp. TaxID=1902409 RepID=UPI0025DADCF6|nr:alpha/beta fold hydrolase BchO [Phaeobacter sp.]